MNARQTSCDRQAIERLLAERLDESEQATLEEHLVECPACRECLEDLAAEPTLWQEARGYLSGGDSGGSEELPHSGNALAGLRGYLTPTDDSRFLGRLGSYGVVGAVGCGGFGIVLKAFDAALNRYVAIKVLSPALAASGAARQRFAREAKAAAAVMHDNVIAIHAVAEADGLPYFVMPYVSGPSLESRLRENGPLAPVEVTRIGMQIAAGLAAAHAQGLVHRDIKPANILLAEGVERVTITDFGLARAVDDASLTRSGVIAGTPQYMSPEQASGLAIDHRSDLFSLGSVMYAACTGRPPFRADTTLAVLRRVEDCRPRPIREVNPDVPDWLAEIVDRLHAKDPAGRYQSAAEVAAFLESWLAHLRQPLAVRAPEMSTRRRDAAAVAAGSTRLHPRAVRAAAVAAVVLIAFGLLRLVAGDGTPQAVAPSAPAPFDVWSIAFTPDGRNVVAGGGLWGQPGEIGCWNAATFAPLRRFAEKGGIGSVAFSPDGKWLASGSWDGHVRVRELITGVEIADFETGSMARVAFSPTDNVLATASEAGEVQICDVAKNETMANLEGDMMRFHCVSFSPDGKRLLAGGGDWAKAGASHVAVWDVASRKQIQKLSGHDRPILSITFSHDGKRIATASVDGTVRLWDADSGRGIRTLKGHGAAVQCAVFSADDRTVISGSEDRTIRFWNADDGKEENKIVSPVTVRTLALSTDSKVLYVGGSQKLLLALDAETHGQLAVLWNNLEGPAAVPPIETLSPEPEGRRGKLLSMAGVVSGLGLALALPLAWVVRRGREADRENALKSVSSSVASSPPTRERGDRRCRLWFIASLILASLGAFLVLSFARPSGVAVVGDRRLAGHTGPVHNVRFLPDGRLLSGSGWPGGDRTVRIWDPNTGEVQKVISVRAQVHALEISADGRLAFVGLSNGQIQIVDPETGQAVKTLRGHSGAVGWLSLTGDGKYAFSAGSDGTARMWDVARATEKKRFTVVNKRARGVAAFADGTRLLTGDGGGLLQVWDVTTGREIKRIERTGFIDSVAVLPDGNQALITGVGGVHVYDLESGQETRTLQEQAEEVHQAALSPDGRLLLAASFDGKARLWDFESGKLVRVLGTHDGVAFAAAFSADGRQAATAGDARKENADLVPADDHDIRVWDLSADWATAPPPKRRPWLAATGGVMLVVGLTFAGAWFGGRRTGQIGPFVHNAEKGAAAGVRPAVTVRCAGCSASLKARPEMVGKTAKCPRCGTCVRVPEDVSDSES